MGLDPEAQRLLAAAKGLPPVESLSVQEVRTRFLEAFGARGEREYVHHVEDRKVPGDETEIPVRIYTPVDGLELAVLVYFHGGGGVVGNLDTHDGLCRTLAKESGAIVVTVDYRLAPEHKYPAALNDCYAATQWVCDHATSIRGDSRRIAVGGDSVGGSLTAGVALMARDRGGPILTMQLMFYPMMDYYEPATQSHKENGSGYFLTMSGIQWFLHHYLPDHFKRDDAYLFPLQSRDLTGLPPALIMTAEYDPLRDEGEAYAKRLQEAGVSVTCRCVHGMMHGFSVMSGRLKKGRSAIKEAALYLKAVFEKC